jgi:hypothetical protein
MRTYTLNLNGSHGKDTVNEIPDQLVRVFDLLCLVYEGKMVIPLESFTTNSSKRSCVEMVDTDRGLKKEVRELESLYSSQGVSFQLEASELRPDSVGSMRLRY